MSDGTGKSALWDHAPVLQDAPLTIFAGLRGIDVCLAVLTFFTSYLCLQWFTAIRLMLAFLAAVAIAVALYAVMLAVRQVGPDGFHWSFLHWFGVLPMRGAVPPGGLRNDPF
jgi:hypothetical protein